MRQSFHARELDETPQSPLDRLVYAYHLDPDNLETIPTARRTPAWLPSFPISIEDSKEDALKAESANTDTWRVYSDGSMIDEGVGAAAIIFKGERKVAELRKYLGAANTHTVYEAELVGILLGTVLLTTFWARGPASIGADNVAALRATRGLERTSGSYLLDVLHDEVEGLLTRRPREDRALSMRWVPGHKGVRGNELCDEAAKKAARGDEYFGRHGVEGLPTVLQGPLPYGRSAIRQSFRSRLKKRARLIFENHDHHTGALSSASKRLRRIDPSSPSPHFRRLVSSLNLTRRQTAMLIQLRTEHIPLQAYLHRIKKEDSPDCPACGERPESVFHFVMACPAHANSRYRLRRAVGGVEFRLERLLNDGAHIEDLFRFIYESKRFAGLAGSLVREPLAPAARGLPQEHGGRRRRRRAQVTPAEAAERRRDGQQTWIQRGWLIAPSADTRTRQRDRA